MKKVKAQLSEEFDMKDLDAAKKILGMEVLRDRKAIRLFLSQKEYIEKVLYRFYMLNAKAVYTPLSVPFKLSFALCPQSNEDIDYMTGVLYLSAVDSLMYAMVCIHPNLVHAVNDLKRYMANPENEHWKVVL